MYCLAKIHVYITPLKCNRLKCKCAAAKLCTQWKPVMYWSCSRCFVVKQHLHLNSVEVYTGIRLVFLQDLCSECSFPWSGIYQRWFLLQCILSSSIVQGAQSLPIFVWGAYQNGDLILSWCLLALLKYKQKDTVI